MAAKIQLVMTTCALILSAGAANAGPCNTKTTGLGDSQPSPNKTAQIDQRQEHAQPSVAQQPKSTGEAQTQPSTTEQSAVPSAKMTDQDQSAASAGQGSKTSSKMADQDC
jgi:hypothetical protein